MSARISLRGLCRLIWVDTLRGGHTASVLVKQLISQVYCSGCQLIMYIVYIDLVRYTSGVLDGLFLTWLYVLNAHTFNESEMRSKRHVVISLHDNLYWQSASGVIPIEEKQGKS